jgi:hypothetical protein
MRIFWHNGALQLLPESRREGELLEELSRNVKFERPPEMNGPSNVGESSGGQDSLDGLMGHHHILPSSNTGKLRDKDTIISIQKLR